MAVSLNAPYQAAPWSVALVGNPNCGKTALFNLLTGARQKVANYAGVTVERKVGIARLKSGQTVSVVDLPGALVYGATRAEAVARAEALALRVLADRLEPGERTPSLDALFAACASGPRRRRGACWPCCSGWAGG